MELMPPPTAGIIVIGNELLTGRTLDQNARYLASELYGLGVNLKRILVVPDDVDDIAEAVRQCSREFDYVFTSGGVGPTHDDVTIAGIARAFGRPIVPDPQLVALIRAFSGDKTDAARLRMAEVPEGTRLIQGPGLRWPVLVLHNVFIMPGIPEVFRRKFDAIRDRFRSAPRFTASIRTQEDEFDIAPRLGEVAAGNPDVLIGSYPAAGKQGDSVTILIEGLELAAVKEARRQILLVLDPARIVPEEPA